MDTDMTASAPQVAKDLGEHLQAAESALRRALDVLHGQQDRGEYFESKHAASLGKWATEVEDLADSVRRQI